jgi:TolB-like protein
MRILAFRSPAVLACVCAALFPGICAGADRDCKALAADIARFAESGRISRISVLEFSHKGGAEKSEADYVSEEIAVHLAGRKKPELIDRAHLEKVLKETKLASGTLGGKAAEEMFSVDAVVTGTVFASGEKLKVLAKLIDVRTGKVLMASLAEAEREWPRLPDVSFSEMRWDSVPWPKEGPGFRDALADTPGSCESRKRRVNDLNFKLVDAKARYWAEKMKEPGFTIRGLTRNPGTEISDPATKSRFYELLKLYYGEDRAAAPAPEELASLKDLMEEENGVYNECRVR